MAQHKYYTRESPDPEHRLVQHNSHYFQNNFTKATEDWIIQLEFKTRTRNEAIFLERFVKKMKSKKFIEKIISKPAILIEILEKTN